MATIDVNDAYVLTHTGQQADKSIGVPFDGTNPLNSTQQAQAQTNLGIATYTEGYVQGMLNRTNAVNVANTAYTTCMARGSALVSTETTPSVNGAICWLYE